MYGCSPKDNKYKMKPQKNIITHTTSIRSKYRPKIFLIFLLTGSLFSIPFILLLKESFSGYHFMPERLYEALFFAFLAYSPWLGMLYFLDKLVYENGIWTVYTFWGLKKKSFSRDEIVGWTEDMIKDEWQLKIWLTTNKTFTLSSSVFKNYDDLRKMLINGQQKKKDQSKIREWLWFIFCTGFGLFIMIITIPDFYNTATQYEKTETVSIKSSMVSIQKNSSKSGHWIEIYLKDYPGFCFQVEDEAYQLIDDKVMEELQAGDEIELTIAKSDYQHCMKDLQSGYVWTEGDSEENMDVFAVKSRNRSYLNEADYRHEKEASAHEMPWGTFLLGLAFFLVGGFLFYPKNK